MRVRLNVIALMVVTAFVSAEVFAKAPTLYQGPGFEFVLFDDLDEPEIVDRIARISAIKGDATIRRNGSDEWEKLGLNLPLVEGDEISVSATARVEIQFDKNTHLRLDENSHLTLSTLRYEGIAVSLSEGTMSVRLIDFDKKTAFFEIDAPKTTLAVQLSGRYDIAAGRDRSSEVRVGVLDDGEARIYSETAGFTLKAGRTTRTIIDGPNAGEWETTDAITYDNEFSQWVTSREAIIDQQLSGAQYGKYYDDDIFGADDLNGNGQWINTPGYGYVWQPSPHATAPYSDWSPYRYGHWRWMQPYGWIWVNDEPWGWATYHYGRWFFYAGRWVWSPYAYYRSSRSWWSPALVVINIYNNNVCWYPLPYSRRRRNYNWNNQPPRNTKVSSRLPRTVIVNPGGRIPNKDELPLGVPARGVVTTDKAQFGTRSMRVTTAPEPIAKTILIKEPDQTPDLPDRKGSGFATARPRIDPAIQTRLGAAPRTIEAPLDEYLRTKRILGGRSPRQTPEADPTRTVEPRKTGAVEREPLVIRRDPVNSPEISRQPIVTREPPRRTPPLVREPERVRTTPRETPRYDPPKQIERSRSSPPPVRTPPKSEPSKPRSDPPPGKSETKPADRPAPTRKPDSQ